MTRAGRLLSIAVSERGRRRWMRAARRAHRRTEGPPDKDERKTVSVNGVVTDSYGIPLVPFQLYKVDDGSGEITVVSRSNSRRHPRARACR